jgi:hypothetical protein
LPGNAVLALALNNHYSGAFCYFSSPVRPPYVPPNLDELT